MLCLSESLRGARVVVTGASTGIGEELAYHYSRFGAQVVITARREKVLQQVSHGISTFTFSSYIPDPFLTVNLYFTLIIYGV